MSDRVFIDSNIFLYSFDKRDEIKQGVSKAILLSPNSTISSQVINEVSSNLIKKFEFDNDMVKKFVKSCFNRYEVIGFTQETFLLACDIRERYNISYWDSLVVASALQSDCEILYSEDMQDGLVLEGRLRIVNPFGL